jgi:predicted hydrocarbon binding protein
MVDYIQKKRKELFLFGEQLSVLDVRSFYYLKKELGSSVRNPNELLYSAGKDAVQMMQSSFVKFLGDSARVLMSYQENALKEFVEVLNYLGLGEISISEFSPKTMKFMVRHSAEAQEYVNLKERSKSPVCYALAGIFAGVWEGIFRNSFRCRETRCIACGDEVCEFVIQSGDDIMLTRGGGNDRQGHKT